MFDSPRLLFDTSDFPARWSCGHWTAVHGWFHILSDLAIAGAYAMIPLAIARYCWVKRSELAFPKVLWLFAAFIFSCGSTHLIEAIIFYYPIYRVSALLKVITAVVSWATVIAIIRIAPQALELPGHMRMNEQLQDQLANTKQAQEATERSNRDLAAFTGIVTHDLRNPLSGALFMAELMKEACAKGDLKLACKSTELLLDSLWQMNQMVGELHAEALSRNDNACLARMSLDELMSTVLEKLAPTLEEAGAKVTIGKLPVVNGNPTLLLQLFSNLIENAVKYRSAEAPVITVLAESDGQQEIVRVMDNGRGIPEADRERIFAPKARGGNADDVPGSGLGLSLCRRIMEQHGRAIIVCDASRGTVFELRFPAEATVN